jgi:hypothetical protein
VISEDGTLTFRDADVEESSHWENTYWVPFKLCGLGAPRPSRKPTACDVVLGAVTVDPATVTWRPAGEVATVTFTIGVVGAANT